MPGIYKPCEDSYLMSKVLEDAIPELLKSDANFKFLEIGSGSGINLETALKCGIKKENILGTDINNGAVKCCKQLGFKCIKSDLFGKIKGKYDLIIFNPPYLPEDKFDKNPDTSGGKKGGEITSRFLKQAKKHLAKNGKIILLTSSITKGIDFQGYRKKILADKNLFFEKLFVLEISL